MVMATIRQRIAGRSLTPGAKLPSVRGLAATLKVSTSTVVDAYERLVAEGAILSRPGSGFYVANQPAPFSLSEVGPRLDRAVDPFWVSRQSLEAGDSGLKPGLRLAAASWLPEEGCAGRCARFPAPRYRPWPTTARRWDCRALRQLIARRMADRGIEASPDQVMLTESRARRPSTCCAVSCSSPATRCWSTTPATSISRPCCAPTAPGSSACPTRLRVRTSSCSREALAEHRPRLYITNSAIHNPTGATLSPVTAHRVLKLADQFGLTIIEDDIFADFEHTPAPRLAAFDGLDRVIHIGSFSKTLSASARCGFVAARPEWIEGLTDLKIATSFGGGRLTAELVCRAQRRRLSQAPRGPANAPGRAPCATSRAG